MHKAVSRALWGAFFVGGLTVLGAGAANAADTSGADSVASGNQVGILGELPVTIGGNAISVLGDSESSGTSTATGGGDAVASTGTTSGEEAILGGNQIAPDLVAPVDASGNAISVIGDSSTDGTQTSDATDGNSDGTTAATNGEDAIASGNQVMPDADLPIIIGGNAISVIGDSSTDGTQTSDATDGNSDGTAAATTGEDAIASGNQVMPDADLPIIIGGNSISVIGDSSTDGTQTSDATDGNSDGTAAATTGEDAIASGNQIAPDVNAPITVTGNDISVIRDDSVSDDAVVSAGSFTGTLEDGSQDGFLDNQLLGDRIMRFGIMNDALATEPTVGESLLSEPADGGPQVGYIDLAVLAPVEVDSAVSNDSTGTDVAGTDFAESGPTPLMATTAVMPAMMLAATGVEALPLIGGIALMLATGLALVGAKRMGYAIG